MISTTLPETVDAGTVAALLQQGTPLALVDVRTPGEFESRHIKGSYNLPLDRLTQHSEELRDVLRSPAVLVCQSGPRAHQAKQALNAAGLHQVHVLDGGITAWERAGHPVKLGRQRWAMDRQVRGVAGAIVLLGTLGGLLLWPPLTLVATFIGAGLTFSAVTNTCGMAMLLSKLPYNRAELYDVRQVITQLSSANAAQA